MSSEILVVDDEADIRDLICDVLHDGGFSTRAANDSMSAIDAINERIPTALVLDIWLEGSQLDGLGILETVKRKFPSLPVIMISGHGNIETATTSIKLGAYDYIEKPFKEDKLLNVVNRAIEAARLKDENSELRQRGALESDLIGCSQIISNLNIYINKVAASSSRVLITGQAGSGKEVIARLIHKKSKRANAPFVILNAASLAEANVEHVLFGSVDEGISGKGRHIGVFEKAHGGTLFIDEVADIPITAQGVLLRILQDNSFVRGSSDKQVKVDVRVIAASNKNLQHEITEGRFKEDLFYRLNVVPIKIPSLKERREDIGPLAEYFVKRCADILGITPKKLSKEAIFTLQIYDWPGNVRQLRNVIEWLLIMTPKDTLEITPDMLPPEISSNNPASSFMTTNSNNDIINMPLRQARELFEKQYITAQLNRFGGNISKTANFIGMERSALHRKLKSLGANEDNDSDSKTTW